MGWLSLWGDRARRRDPIGPFLWDHTSCVQGTTQAVSKGPHKLCPRDHPWC